MYDHVWKQVRDLVAENGDLKVDFRRAKAEVVVLTAERRGLEERYILRTPSPPPAPPVGDTEAGAVSGREGSASALIAPVLVGGIRDANRQHVENDKDGDDMAPTGATPAVGEGPRELKPLVLQNAPPNTDDDHSGCHATTAGDARVSGAARSPSAGAHHPGLGDGGATPDENDQDRAKTANGLAPGLELEAAEQENDAAQAFKRESDSDTSNSQSDDEFWASCGRDVGAGRAGSSKTKAFDSCDSASSEYDAEERAPDESATGKQNDGGAQEELATSTAQATADFFDRAFQLNVVRPGRRRAVSSRSLVLQRIGARTGSAKVLRKSSKSGSGFPHSTSLPGSFLVAGGGSADRSSSGETSVGEVENGAWPSGSFIIAKAKIEETRDDQDDVQVSTDSLPLEGTRSSVKQPLMKREPRGRTAHNIDSFLNDGSQSSSGSRSPGG